MTAINKVDLSNTPFDLIQAVNTLGIDHNNLTEPGSALLANGVLILAGPGTALTVNNAASFGSINATTIQATTVIGTNVVVRGIDVLTHANNAYNAANTDNTLATTANTIAVQSGASANQALTIANTANAIAVQSGVTANQAWAVANTANTVPGSNGDFLFANAGFKFATTNKVNINLTSNTVTFSCNLATGDIASTGNVTASSDRALKNNIITLVSALPTIKKLEGVSYNLKTDGYKHYGFIAQDVEKVIPEIVHGPEGSKSLAYVEIIAFCVEAIKELEQRVKDLENGQR
jgi:hypothetical protein